MKYAIAMHVNGIEEYLKEWTGDNCFTDDIGDALLFDSPEETDDIKLQENEYFVPVDDEDGLSVIGKI